MSTGAEIGIKEGLEKAVPVAAALAGVREGRLQHHPPATRAADAVGERLARLEGAAFATPSGS